MRIVLATLIVAGCSFEHGNDPGSPVDDPGVDASTGSGSGSGSGSAIACKFQEADLRMCIEFDDGKLSPAVTDASVFQWVANATKVNSATRNSTPAAAVYWESRMAVAEHPMLDISPHITFEGFLYLAAYPPFGSFSFLRNEGQYQMSIDSSGKLRCWIGNQSTETSIGQDAWHHVACVYDGQKLKIYIDGSVAKCSDLSNAIPTGGTQGTRIVDNGLTAGIDDVRIYARALTTSEICSHANNTSCNSSCPET